MDVRGDGPSIENIIRKCEGEVLDFYQNHHDAPGKGSADSRPCVHPPPLDEDEGEGEAQVALQGDGTTQIGL